MKNIRAFYLKFSICIYLNENFNESLTNDVVSFEQLGPDQYFPPFSEKTFIIIWILDRGRVKHLFASWELCLIKQLEQGEHTSQVGNMIHVLCQESK